MSSLLHLERSRIWLFALTFLSSSLALSLGGTVTLKLSLSCSLTCKHRNWCYKFQPFCCFFFFFPSIKAFAVPEGFSSASAAQDSKSEDREQAYRAPEIIPMYGVSAKMVPLFQDSGHRWALEKCNKTIVGLRDRLTNLCCYHFVHLQGEAIKFSFYLEKEASSQAVRWETSSSTTWRLTSWLMKQTRSKCT